MISNASGCLKSGYAPAAVCLCRAFRRTASCVFASSATLQVLAIYEEHNKEKLHTVDGALDKYEGRWEEMLKVTARIGGLALSSRGGGSTSV